ncbi:hypothetical protein MMC30_007798 [Trapelia coarctata]|nr:hypothetical protein [Trapelia coarctata]
MASPSTPIPLICFGAHRDLAQRMEQSLTPRFAYPAIVTSFGDLSVLTTLLNTLNPTPRGVIVGGGMKEDGVEEVQRIVAEWNEARPEGAEIPVVKVPAGTFEAGGPAGLVKWIREELGRVYKVEW